MVLLELKFSDNDFDYFWKGYPKKRAKKEAQKAWVKLTPAQKKAATEAVKQHVNYWAQKGTDIDFIPHASTWLNQERWEDELERATKWHEILTSTD